MIKHQKLQMVISGKAEPSDMSYFSPVLKMSPRFTCRLFLMVLLPATPVRGPADPPDPPALPFLIIAANSL
jgi:hypothetical protein